MDAPSSEPDAEMDEDHEVDSSDVMMLEQLVAKLKKDSALIHKPALAFFKDFLIDHWGAKIPAAAPAASSTRHAAPKATPATEPVKERATEPEVCMEEEEEEEEDEEEPIEPEEEDAERLPEDHEPFPQQAPGDEKELTDEQLDAQGAAKQEAVEAVEDGDLAKAVEKYTEAIMIGNPTALMYAKRADFLLKMKRPNACIADCNAAIGINPDSGKAFRLRGKAHRKLGHWEEAHRDISMGQKLDYDEDTLDVQKFIADKWKKISERQTRKRLRDETVARKRKERDVKRRRAEAQRVYEEAKKAPNMSNPSAGFFSMPGGADPGLLQGLLKDPELMAAFSNPKTAAAMKDLMANPANISKYKDDPEVMRLYMKAMGGGRQNRSTDPFSSPGPTIEEVTEDNVDGVD